jgi:hypothetical protein
VSGSCQKADLALSTNEVSSYFNNERAAQSNVMELRWPPHDAVGISVEIQLEINVGASGLIPLDPHGLLP